MSKPILLLSTSPGGRGGISILNIAAGSYGYLNGRVIGQLAVPSFNENFSDTEGIKDGAQQSQLLELTKKLHAEMMK